MLEEFCEFYGDFCRKLRLTGRMVRSINILLSQNKAEGNFLNREWVMFLHLPNLVMLHHNSAG